MRTVGVQISRLAEPPSVGRCYCRVKMPHGRAQRAATFPTCVRGRSAEDSRETYRSRWGEGRHVETELLSDAN
jgi:hypothetical protein